MVRWPKRFSSVPSLPAIDRVETKRSRVFAAWAWARTRQMALAEVVSSLERLQPSCRRNALAATPIFANHAAVAALPDFHDPPCSPVVLAPRRLQRASA